jgi:hypothetical protein
MDTFLDRSRRFPTDTHYLPVRSSCMWRSWSNYHSCTPSCGRSSTRWCRGRRNCSWIANMRSGSRAGQEGSSRRSCCCNKRHCRKKRPRRRGWRWCRYAGAVVAVGAAVDEVVALASVDDVPAGAAPDVVRFRERGVRLVGQFVGELPIYPVVSCGSVNWANTRAATEVSPADLRSQVHRANRVRRTDHRYFRPCRAAANCRSEPYTH